MREYSLNDTSAYQDEENALYEECFIGAVRRGWMHVAGEDEGAENSYRELCEKEGRPLILLDDRDVETGEDEVITVEDVRPEQVDQLVAVATEAGAEILEVDKRGGSLIVSTNEMTIGNVAERLTCAIWPAAGDPAEESEIVATVDNVHLTQRQLNSLSRAFRLGYLYVHTRREWVRSYFSLYTLAMERRDRPSVLVMPKWGERRSVVVSSLNREAIRRSAQSARDAGAEVIVEAETVNLMCAVCENERVEAVAQAICESWYAYEKERSSQTAIERHVLELTAGMQS